MQLHSDRFETVLPKEHFFTRPPAPPVKQQQKPVWGYLLVGVIIGAICMALPRPQPAPVPVTAPAAVAPTPPPLPDPAPPVTRALPVGTMTAPRAQLVHVRPIGTYENVQMPDGRVLMTHYMGELPNTMRLPTRGAQLGDMWYTRMDQHCWVLAPLSTGSQAIGWVDP